ncbi:hypothetical protein ABZP36_028596 [Zizania latifolia]
MFPMYATWLFYLRVSELDDTGCCAILVFQAGVRPALFTVGLPVGNLYPFTQGLVPVRMLLFLEMFTSFVCSFQLPCRVLCCCSILSTDPTSPPWIEVTMNKQCD